MTACDDAVEFLSALWDGKPDDLWILIWTVIDKQSRWFQNIGEAAEYAARTGVDTYSQVSLSTKDRGPTKRCLAKDSAGICGMWADIDYISEGAHKLKGLPASESDARKLIKSIGLEPTLIVHSGHGLQPWWLFKEPLIFETPQEREEAALFAKQWEAAIQVKAKAAGWRVDATADLARVLRIPGTFNLKADPRVAVRITENGGPRYADWDDFEPIVTLTEATAESTIRIPADGDARDWEYYRVIIEGIAEGERNSKMLSIAGKLLRNVEVESTTQIKILNGLLKVLNESRFLPPLEDREFMTVFSSALKMEAKRQHDEQFEESFESRHEDILLDVASEGHQLEIIKRKFGGLPIKKIIKRGKQQSEYSFELEDGQMIRIGSSLNQQGRVRSIIRDATGGRYHLKQLKQPAWDALSDKIAELAEDIDLPDEDRCEEIEYCYEKYIDTTPIFPYDERADAFLTDQPFVKDGVTHIHLVNFYLFSGRGMLTQLDKDEFRKGVSELGFSWRRISARRDGKSISKAYWARG